MNCPTHNSPMHRNKSRYGYYYKCGVAGCDVACGSGETSTPADKKTRHARMRAHAMFDPLWKQKKAFKFRGDAYRWLQEVMQVEPSKNHIGMFTFEQCEQLCGMIADLLGQQVH